MSRPRKRDITLEDLRATLATLDLRYSGLRAMAEHYEVSPGTLHNRLKAAGTNWESELRAEKIRRFEEEAATGEIKHGYEYAKRLGFWETGSFYPAFKNWYGIGFCEWRRQRAGA